MSNQIDANTNNPPVDGGCKDFCGTVVNPRTLPICENVPFAPVTSPTPVIAKVPVVLAERTVQVDIEAKIKLDRPAIEIKRIKKQLFLTQCKLIPRVGKLFISGYIRKNIEYATAKCASDDCVSGDIRHTTCNVPFDCVTFIPYELGAYPVFKANCAPTEFQTFDQKLMGADPTEQEFESVQNFNEKIFCELVSARFHEVDISYDCKRHAKDANGEIEFDKITEKITVFLTFKLLQLQQVPIGGTVGGIGSCDNKSN
jgi:hypothetical protein